MADFKAPSQLSLKAPQWVGRRGFGTQKRGTKSTWGVKGLSQSCFSAQMTHFCLLSQVARPLPFGECAKRVTVPLPITKRRNLSEQDWVIKQERYPPAVRKAAFLSGSMLPTGPHQQWSDGVL